MEQTNKKSKSFVLGAAILGVAGLITKLLGAAFRIPLTNIIGTEGMAYYQTAYPVYTLLLMLSTSGLPTAISRMVAERRAQDQYYEAKRVFKVAFVLMCSLGVITSIGLYFLAPYICELQLEPDAIYAMRAIAPALLLCPMMSCFRGFFQGRKTMIPTALSQVCEQIFRVGLGLFLASLLFKIDAPHAAAGASFGATAGAIFGLITVLIIFIKNKPLIDAEITEVTKLQPASSILKDVLFIAVPVTLGSAIMPILNSIDTLIVKRRLLAIGYDAVLARKLFGELTGMASPIVNFPVVFSQAVCMSLVPVITDAFKRGDYEFVRSNASTSFKYAASIMFPCAGGMIALSEPIMRLLYPTQQSSIESAAKCLVVYAIGMIFLGITHAMTGVLQGIGKQIIPVKNLFIGAVVKIVITYIFTGISSINVMGAAIGTASAYFVACMLNILAVRKNTQFVIDVKTAIIKPVISAVLMSIFAMLIYKVLSLKLGNSVSCLCAVVAGAIIYAVLIVLTGVVSITELKKVLKKK